MIEVQEMETKQIQELLRRVQYGHLACTDGRKPYLVPIHFAYEQPYIYVYTTEGKKTEMIRHNPRVCLQLEDVKDNKNWSSVIIDGEAEELTDSSDREKALKAITRVNPTLTPAVSIRWMDSWVRENIEVIYRIVPVETSGRESVLRSDSQPPFIPSKKSRSRLH
jgi:nitroimidazol reductase NimA-like FMN-containing flavoprotein (pyridoxamine 5'-phosphate oxidase superfamily)